MMKLLLFGSRTIGKDVAKRIFYLLIKKNCTTSNIECILSGDAQGADKGANMVASLLHAPLLLYPPEYKQYGKNAPLIRNMSMVKGCTHAIGLQLNGSRGTLFTHQQLMKAQKPHIMYYIEKTHIIRYGWDN